MTYDPQSTLGPADGIIINKTGKQVGWMWENPNMIGMSRIQADEYWKRRDKITAPTPEDDKRISQEVRELYK